MSEPEFCIISCGEFRFKIVEVGGLIVRISPCGEEIILPRNEILQLARKQIESYFEGKLNTFSIPLYLGTRTAFERDVYEACQRIPYGSTASYKELAEMSGHPNASRAVGTTLKRNPHLLVTPCHRVIRADGSFGEYAGGSKMKKRFLDLEKQVLEGVYG